MVAAIHKKNVPLLPDCNLVASCEFDIAVARIYDNQVLHVYFFSGANIDLAFIDLVYAFVDTQPKPTIYRNLFEFEQHVDLEPEVREWASAPEGNKNTIADALVINSLAQQLLANFYMKFNKPIKPTKVFNQQDKALRWLLAQE